MLQVAADGEWERATATDVTCDATGTIGSVARSAHADIAVEVFWPGSVFVGARWPREEWRDAVAAVTRVRAALTDPSPTGSVERALLELIGAPPDRAVEQVDLGAVNAWQTTGPLRLWRRGDRTRADLQRRPDLLSCSHPVAVEVSVSRPRPCWIGIVVSTEGPPGQHQLDRRALDDVLSQVPAGSATP